MNTKYKEYLKSHLIKLSSAEKAKASKRYFPDGIHCIGANAADIITVIKNFQIIHPELTAENTLCLTEYLLHTAEYSEEALLAFGLLNEFVKKHYDDSLLLRFEYWLKNYATNWSHVDDLCIKTIYNFSIARPELIVETENWVNSTSPWCRRAGNVVWVKFINRKIGKITYMLDKGLVSKTVMY